MRYYPVNLDVRGRCCLVVGAGAVGTRKVGTLLECGAHVKVVSPEADERLVKLAAEGKIELVRKKYETGDLEGAFLVIGATDDRDLNRRIHQDAESIGCLCNIVDQPGLCSFILPSVVRRGDLVIAISTSGSSPAFARHLRLQLQNQFGEEYEKFLKLMGAIRKQLLGANDAPETHKQLFARLLEGNLLELIKTGELEKIDSLLHKVLGPGFNYAKLMDQAP